MGNLGPAMANANHAAHGVSRRIYLAADGCPADVYSAFLLPTTLPALFLGRRTNIQRCQCRRASRSSPFFHGAEPDEPYQPAANSQQRSGPPIRHVLRQLRTPLLA